jgi:hypothetical protein
MAELKLKIKKQLMKRKVDGATLTGYIGKVITNGRKSFDEIARASAKNTTLHPKEASLAAELLLEGVAEQLQQGYIVDMGPLGVITPAVNTPWKQDADELQLSEMRPKVNYKASDGVMAAVKSASLAWATQNDEQNGTEAPAGDDDVTTPNTGNPEQGGDNTGGQGDGGIE